MEFASVITFAGYLFAGIAGLYAGLKTTNIKILRESNTDYKERNGQLEATLTIQAKQIEDLQHKVRELERQKQLPFDNLTEMLMKYHTEQADTMNALAVQIGNLAKEIAKGKV